MGEPIRTAMSINVHHLHDLRGVRLGQRPAEYGEVLCERIDLTAIDAPVAGYDAVARHDLIVHAEIATAMRDELVELLERAGVEQQVDALARGQLAGVMLSLEAVFPAAEFGETLEFGQALRRRHHTLAALFCCAFCQSARNRSRPMSVSGCLKQDSMTAGGHVQTSAPIRAASTMCIG
jgi:hypothetical protein